MSGFKYCPSCKSSQIIKKGIRRRVQKYFCKNCNKYFQSKRQKSRKEGVLVNQYVFKKRQLKILA